MKRLQLGQLLDIARLASPSVERTLKLLQRRFRKRPPFTYRVARRVAFALWSGDLKLSVAKAAVDKARLNVLGKRCNHEVIEAIYELSKHHNRLCYRLSPQPYQIRRDAYIPVPLEFYFTNSGKPNLVFLQPRKTHAPDDRALGMIAGIIEEVYLPDVFEEADLFLLDLQSGDKEREPRVLGFSDLPRMPQEEIRDLLEVYLEAHRLYELWAAEQPPEERKKRSPERDSGQFDLPFE